MDYRQEADKWQVCVDIVNDAIRQDVNDEYLIGKRDAFQQVADYYRQLAMEQENELSSGS